VKDGWMEPETSMPRDVVREGWMNGRPYRGTLFVKDGLVREVCATTPRNVAREGVAPPRVVSSHQAWGNYGLARPDVRSPREFGDGSEGNAQP
jgi:hypothetical protein